jgi:MerR family mercuric resistance operon transcriptional regulator
MRSKQVADRAGVNTETLRYYERRGLLPEPPRTPGGYRVYPDSTVLVLRFVKRSQVLGFSLAEVEDLLSLAEGGPESCDAARELAMAHLGDLEGRIAELERMRLALVELVDSCSRPRRDRSCPLLEAIQDPAEPLIADEDES